MTTRRHPSDIAEMIADIVPSHEHAQQLRDLARNYSYRSPEDQARSWDELSAFVTTIVGTPPLPRTYWRFVVLGLLMDITPQAAYVRFGEDGKGGRP